LESKEKHITEFARVSHGEHGEAGTGNGKWKNGTRPNPVDRKECGSD
jgi:hypothetical protein